MPALAVYDMPIQAAAGLGPESKSEADLRVLPLSKGKVSISAGLSCATLGSLVVVGAAVSGDPVWSTSFGAESVYSELQCRTG